MGHRTVFYERDDEHPRLDITLPEEVGPFPTLQPGLGVTEAEDIVVEGPSHRV